MKMERMWSLKSFHGEVKIEMGQLEKGNQSSPVLTPGAGELVAFLFSGIG